ncbi:hypothetical protein PanWU01x14_134160 [Parasponia andersonii]|uniref:Uncharacterized protein n=1 Tax=Parasponia andersonii TaxID=3476 RepID=A0A2P5CPJ0_PARAD|nr:hypothetical protein PanWU01x14_134160 [Parasponia andersonii]
MSSFLCRESFYGFVSLSTALDGYHEKHTGSNEVPQIVLPPKFRHLPQHLILSAPHRRNPSQNLIISTCSISSAQFLCPSFFLGNVGIRRASSSFGFFDHALHQTQLKVPAFFFNITLPSKF